MGVPASEIKTLQLGSTNCFTWKWRRKMGLHVQSTDRSIRATYLSRQLRLPQLRVETVGIRLVDEETFEKLLESLRKQPLDCACWCSATWAPYVHIVEWTPLMATGVIFSLFSNAKMSSLIVLQNIQVRACGSRRWEGRFKIGMGFLWISISNYRVDNTHTDKKRRKKYHVLSKKRKNIMGACAMLSAICWNIHVM